jgi:hypothetical protein
MQFHVSNILFALQPTFWICMLLISCVPSLPKIAIAIHHCHGLDLNHKLCLIIAITQSTILNFQITKTDMNISSRLRLEVSAFSSQSCVNINDREAKASAKLMSPSNVPLCPSPASPL